MSKIEEHLAERVLDAETERKDDERMNDEEAVVKDSKRTIEKELNATVRLETRVKDNKIAPFVKDETAHEMRAPHVKPNRKVTFIFCLSASSMYEQNVFSMLHRRMSKIPVLGVVSVSVQSHYGYRSNYDRSHGGVTGFRVINLRENDPHDYTTVIMLAQAIMCFEDHNLYTVIFAW